MPESPALIIMPHGSVETVRAQPGFHVVKPFGRLVIGAAVIIDLAEFFSVQRPRLAAAPALAQEENLLLARRVQHHPGETPREPGAARGVEAAGVGEVPPLELAGRLEPLEYNLATCLPIAGQPERRLYSARAQRTRRLRDEPRADRGRRGPVAGRTPATAGGARVCRGVREAGRRLRRGRPPRHRGDHRRRPVPRRQGTDRRWRVPRRCAPSAARAGHPTPRAAC